jgi:beta-phosphoglucomutase-like phosphatase (HAD superfamily)
VIVAAEDVAAAKPAPDAHRKAFERLRRRRTLDLRAAIALEPGAVGARAAHAAGIRCIVVGAAAGRPVADADATIPSLAGHTAASLDELLSLRAVG